MPPTEDPTSIWQVRAFIYEQFAKTAHAPELAAIAAHFGITPDQAGQVLQTLHDRHAIFLEPGTVTIRMANPFSAVATPFQVEIAGRTYTANCAWDCLGIVAALHAPEAVIHAPCAGTGTDLHLRITANNPNPSDAIVHFLVPFRNWYDDLVFT